MTTADVLAQHIDSPQQRHRLVLQDPRHLRCLDCTRTLVLPAQTAAGQTTSTSTSPPPLHAPNRCPQHPGQTAGACGPCRAEQLAADDQPRPPAQPTADVAAGIAACRNALRRPTEETVHA